MTKTEQNRLKILLLILLGVVVVIFAASLLFENNKQKEKLDTPEVPFDPEVVIDKEIDVPSGIREESPESTEKTPPADLSPDDLKETIEAVDGELPKIPIPDGTPTEAADKIEYQDVSDGGFVLPDDVVSNEIINP
jgi:Flp pilus assembly protein CpaB